MNTESASARGEESGRENDQDPTQQGRRPRGGDRRADGGGLFGGYNGPERRSGRDRRAGT